MKRTSNIGSLWLFSIGVTSTGCDPFLVSQNPVKKKKNQIEKISHYTKRVIQVIKFDFVHKKKNGNGID